LVLQALRVYKAPQELLGYLEIQEPRVLQGQLEPLVYKVLLVLLVLKDPLAAQDRRAE
jgi:hypothetical protein